MALASYEHSDVTLDAAPHVIQLVKSIVAIACAEHYLVHMSLDRNLFTSGWQHVSDLEDDISRCFAINARTSSHISSSIISHHGEARLFST